jgi:hypothetical protein
MTLAMGGGQPHKLIHAVAATPANVADSTVSPELLHGHEIRADAFLLGQCGKRHAIAAGGGGIELARPDQHLNQRHVGSGEATGCRHCSIRLP